MRIDRPHLDPTITRQGHLIRVMCPTSHDQNGRNGQQSSVYSSKMMQLYIYFVLPWKRETASVCYAITVSAPFFFCIAFPFLFRMAPPNPGGP